MFILAVDRETGASVLIRRLWRSEIDVVEPTEKLGLLVSQLHSLPQQCEGQCHFAAPDYPRGVVFLAHAQLSRA